MSPYDGLVTAKEYASLDCVHLVNTAPFPDPSQSGRCVAGAGWHIISVPETPGCLEKVTWEMTLLASPSVGQSLSL